MNWIKLVLHKSLSLSEGSLTHNYSFDNQQSMAAR